MTHNILQPPEPSVSQQPAPRAGFLMRLRESDVAYSFFQSPSAMISAVVLVIFFVCSFLAFLIAPYDPYDLASLNLMDSLSPPMAEAFSGNRYLLGTDDQGRDILSTILHGTKISLIVGLLAVGLAMVIGIVLGLASAYLGGWVESAIMRLADIQLSFPSILVAMLIFGVVRISLPGVVHETLALFILIIAIALSDWVQYARAVRGSAMVELNKDYVKAAKVTGVHPLVIAVRHVLPNVASPISVLATLGLAQAILAEASLSFLGMGMPPTMPSLGTLIRQGNNYLFSGEWWITLLPGVTLVILAISVNLFGDWLRDVLNPRLR